VINIIIASSGRSRQRRLKWREMLSELSLAEQHILIKTDKNAVLSDVISKIKAEK
jgi:hypothetical protein